MYNDSRPSTIGISGAPHHVTVGRLVTTSQEHYHLAVPIQPSGACTSPMVIDSETSPQLMIPYDATDCTKSQEYQPASTTNQALQISEDLNQDEAMETSEPPIELPEEQVDLSQEQCELLAQSIQLQGFLRTHPQLFEPTIRERKLVPSKDFDSNPEWYFQLLSAPSDLTLFLPNAFKKKFVAMSTSVKANMLTMMESGQFTMATITQAKRMAFEQYVEHHMSRNINKAKSQQQISSSPTIVTETETRGLKRKRGSPMISHPTHRPSPMTQNIQLMRWPIQVIIEFRNWPDKPQHTTETQLSISNQIQLANSILEKYDLKTGQSLSDICWLFWKDNEWIALSPVADFPVVNTQSRSWYLIIYYVQRLSEPAVAPFSGPKQRLRTLRNVPWNQATQEWSEMFRNLTTSTDNYQLRIRSNHDALTVIQICENIYTNAPEEVKVLLADLLDVQDPFTWFMIQPLRHIISRYSVNDRRHAIPKVTMPSATVSSSKVPTPEFQNLEITMDTDHHDLIELQFDPQQAFLLPPSSKPSATPNLSDTGKTQRPTKAMISAHPTHARPALEYAMLNDPMSHAGSNEYRTLNNEVHRDINRQLPLYGFNWLLPAFWRENIPQIDTHVLQSLPLPEDVLTYTLTNIFDYLPDKGRVFRHSQMWTLPSLYQLAHLMVTRSTGTWNVGHLVYEPKYPTPAEESIIPDLQRNMCFLDDGAWFMPVLNFGVTILWSQHFLNCLLDNAAHPMPPRLGGIQVGAHLRPTQLEGFVQEANATPLTKITSTCEPHRLFHTTWATPTFVTDFTYTSTISSKNPASTRTVALVCLHHPTEQPSIALLLIDPKSRRPPALLNIYKTFDLGHYTYDPDEISIAAEGVAHSLATAVVCTIPYSKTNLLL